MTTRFFIRYYYVVMFSVSLVWIILDLWNIYEYDAAVTNFVHFNVLQYLSKVILKYPRLPIFFQEKMEPSDATSEGSKISKTLKSNRTETSPIKRR